LKGKVLATIQKHRMLAGKDKVLVAVSGGPDSVALLHLLNQLRDEFSLQLAIAHYHHQLRGKDADLDEKLAQEMAEKLGLEFFSGRAEPEWWKRMKGSIEELARKMRYEFLLKSAKEFKADEIALGHNADDLAESFLINLLRGSGLLGLAGMPPKRDKLIRPLIEVSRQEILDYCWENSLAFRVDKSNQDKQFLRNRIRAELIPMLKTFNPAIVSAIGKTSELLRADEKILEQESEGAFSKLAQIRPDRVEFHLPEFSKEELAIRRRLVRLAIRELKKDLRRIESGHIFELEELLDSGKASFELDLPDGVRIFKSYDQLRLELSRPKKKAGFEPMEIIVPGSCKIQLSDEFTLELKAELADYDRFKKQGKPKARRNSVFELGSDQAFLSLDQISGSLWLRAPKPGDRIQPLGMKGHKKLKEILQELKVPRHLRPIYPLITDHSQLLWVPGYAISEKSKLTPASRRIFLFKICFRKTASVR